jgi:DNA topoisomerase-1
MSALEAGLRYVDPTGPGITRHRAGKGFFYRNAAGERITDKKDLDRIRKIVIPPAWTDVWICPFSNGHVQAVGRDTKGRRQARYHPRWREVRDETKYERMLLFGRHLPAIRERVDADLRRHGLPKEKVVAAVVHLLEATLIRVGNEQYAKTNNSFGLTTMLDQHVDVRGSKLEFHFKGKSGVEHQIEFRNRKIANLVKRCQDLPGQELFQYLDQNDEPQTISSDDVNRYLREITGEEFTAKDFRTWAGTVLAAEALASFEAVDSDTRAKKNVVTAIESVAARLGNTKTICRKCYVHPAVIDAYLEGDTVETVKDRVEQELAESLADLPPEEAAVLTLLHHRLDQAS